MIGRQFTALPSNARCIIVSICMNARTQLSCWCRKQIGAEREAQGTDRAGDLDLDL